MTRIVIALICAIGACVAADGPLRGLREVVLSVHVTKANDAASIASAASAPFINAGLIVHPSGTKLPPDRPWGAVAVNIEAVQSGGSGDMAAYTVSVEVMQFGVTEAGGTGAIITARKGAFGIVGINRFASIDWNRDVSELALQIVNDWRIQNQ